MNSRFDDIWRGAAADGACAFTGIDLTRSETGSDLDELLDAWYRERTDRIECSLILEQAQRLIAAILAKGELTAQRRQADNVIRSIREVRKAERGNR